MPSPRPSRFALPGVLTLALVAGLALLPPTSVAAQQGDTPASLVDDRIDEAERQVLLSTVGYAVPEFGDDVVWLGEEQPDFGSLRGRVVVLNTWNSETTDGRNMTRRVTTLLRKYGDDVQQIALHTPEEADEIVAKYERHSGRLPVPTAIDTRGAYLDELGIYKEPRIIVIDRDGRIAHAGVSLSQLRDAVQRTLDIEVTPAVMPEALPPRAERVDEEEAPVAQGEPNWPEPNRIQAGSANNLQGRQAPALRVESYLNTDAPDTSGKVVMMEFWATWCGPCINGIPHLNELQAAYPDDLVIVGISAEDEQHVRNKMRTDQRLDFQYAVAVDTRRSVQSVVGNRGIPHCIVVSSDGVVRWQGHPARLTDSVMGQIVEANRTLGGGGSMRRWVSDS
ncbi:MAG: hypothetical protein Tsb0013_21770 [Phycisphaerales bacterium]